MKFNAALVLTMILAAGAQASGYKIDGSHTTKGFKVRHLAFSNVRGHFKKFSGQGTYDEKTGKIGNLDVEIEANTVDTNEPDRDKHLRSEDFFHVEKYPKLQFKSTKIEYSGKKPKKIHGVLTMRGVSKPIILKIEEWGGLATDAWGNQRIAFEAAGTIDRRKFGLKWNKGLKKIGGLTVGNDVKLVLAIQGIKVDAKKM